MTVVRVLMILQGIVTDDGKGLRRESLAGA